MLRERKEAVMVWICLILSTGTLLCCTLPIILVMLGLGALMALLAMHAGWIAVLLEYKFWLFLVSGLLLLIADIILRQPGRACPTDPVLAKKCAWLTRSNRWILRISLLLWAIGFMSAYLVLPVSIWLGKY